MHAQLCPTLCDPWTAAHQVPLSMGFPRQEYWSGWPFPSGDLPDPGIEPRSPMLQVDTLSTEPPGKPICMLKGSSFLILQRGELAQREKFSTETVQLRQSWNPSILSGKNKALSEVEGIWRLIHLPHFLQRKCESVNHSVMFDSLQHQGL